MTLAIEHVSRRYGDVVALDDMTFDVRPGEIFGFVGSNGAGKTTTMRIVLGVLSADSGEVRWRGQPIDSDVRRVIGYMPEERGLYPRMKVGEQLRYLAQLHGMEKAAASEAVDRWTERLGVSGRRDDVVQALSLGNQQRVQLAAALSHDPEILVLDEPFSGLDPAAVDVMSEVLRDKADSGVPVIFSSHQLDLVERICDRVGVVRQGRLVASGTVAELQAQGPSHLVVEGPQTDWTVGLAGVHVVQQHNGRSVLALADGTDPQQVLHRALEAGPVTEFGTRRASLAELFRDIVAVPEESR